jgi:hypothetical protein
MHYAIMDRLHTIQNLMCGLEKFSAQGSMPEGYETLLHRLEAEIGELWRICLTCQNGDHCESCEHSNSRINSESKISST